MKIIEAVDRLGLQVLCGKTSLEKEITGGYVSDLLSDVMGHAAEGNIWITMQSHKNVIAVAVLKDLSAILVVNGNLPDEDTLAQAEKEDVVVLSTTATAFDITGRIFNLMYGNEPV